MTSSCGSLVCHQFRCCLVVQEEVKTINSKVYKDSVRWLGALEELIETMQVGMEGLGVRGGIEECGRNIHIP